MDRTLRAVLAFVAFGVVVTAVVLAVWAFAVRRVRRTGRDPADPDAPTDDPLASELVPRLTDELRKWQAEAGYWRRTAERLQRELDQRRDPGS